MPDGLVSTLAVEWIEIQIATAMGIVVDKVSTLAVEWIEIWSKNAI